MGKHRTVAVFAAGHFLVDLACAFAMLRWVRPSGSWTEAVLLYDFFAFAGQMPLGLMSDRFGNGRGFAGAGCLLVSAAYLLPGAPMALAVISGLGNALYHIGGGRDVLALSEGKAGPLGVFVSPGALGLFLGAALGRGRAPAFLPPVLLLGAAAAVWLLCGKSAPKSVSLELSGAGLPALTALFLVVVLRSLTGFLLVFPWKTGGWAWVFVLCVAMGKALGGRASDRLGVRTAALASLGLAAALFLLSGSPVCGCAAVLLFNMTMPVTLRGAADLLPGAEGFSFGLLTFALFLGFLPAYLDLPLPGGPWVYAGACLLSLALLLPALGKRP